MRPSPPAAVTAAASLPPAADPIGASTIGCSIPRRSVNRVRSATSMHRYARSFNDPAVSLVVAADTSLEFIERGYVGLAGAGPGQSVGEVFHLDNRAHVLAQPLDDIRRRAGGCEQPLPEGGFIIRIELGDTGQIGQFGRPDAARHG